MTPTKRAAALDHAQVLALIRSAVQAAGGQKAFALANGLSPQYINDVLWGRREPGARLLAAIGYQKLVLYEKR